MVANGNEQDPEVYSDCSSPAFVMHSIFICLAVSACKNYKVSKIDIKGAFIQMEMKGMLVCIKCHLM